MPSTMYRKRPVDGSTICKAFRWHGEPVEGFERVVFGRFYRLAVPTPAGMRYAAEGDWIIRGFEGNLGVCKPDAFDVDYERYIPPAGEFSVAPWPE